MGRAAYVTAVSVTFFILVLSQFTGLSASPNPPVHQDGQMTPQMRRDIINNLREKHRQVLAKLKSVKLECNTKMPDTLREVIEPAQGWLQAVDQLSLRNSLTRDDLTSEETEKLILDRVSAQGLTGRDYQNRVRALTRSGIEATDSELRTIERDRLRREGYNNQEIEDLLKETDALRAEFQKMYDELNQLIWETLKKAYDKAHQCCMKEAKEFYLGMMDSLGRQLTIAGQGESVSMEKRNECLCAIESVTAGLSGAWSGEITHTEHFVDDRDVNTGTGGTTRRSKHYKKSDYRAVINLVYHTRSLVAAESGSRIPARVSVNGSVESSGIDENRWTSASMDKRQGSESQLNYSGKIFGEDASVEVQVRPDGTYHVTYDAPCAEGSGVEITRRYTEGTGFPEFQKRDDKRSRIVKRGVCPTQPGVLLRNGQHIGITGQLDTKSTKTISGSKTFEVPLDENPQVMKTITITWKLNRCK